MTVVGRRLCTRTEGLRAYYHYSTATITTITIRFRSLIGMVIKGYQGMGRGTQRRICKTGSYQMYFNMADVLVLADALGPSLLPLQQWYDFLGHGFRGARRTQVVRRVIGLIIAHYPPDGGGGVYRRTVCWYLFFFYLTSHAYRVDGHRPVATWRTTGWREK